PAKVTLAQLRSVWARIAARPCARSSSATRKASLASRRAIGRSGNRSASIVVSSVFVHEMFHSVFRAGARFAAVAQIEHEAGIAHRQAAELGRAHPGAA